jgi:hypothetical protein
MGDDPGSLAHELADGMAQRERGVVGILGIPWGGTIRQVEGQERIRVILGEVGIQVAAR